MSATKVAVKDRGARKLIGAVDAPALKVKVGIFGDAAAARAVGGDGATVGQIADAHELGLGNVPERSFIRAYADANKDRINAMIKRAAAAVAKGQFSPEKAADLLGLQVVGEIKDRIADGIPPPLSPNYLPRKLAKHPGASTPLIASGQMRQAVAHAVEAKK